MSSKLRLVMMLVVFTAFCSFLVGAQSGCDDQRANNPISASGVSKAKVEIPTGPDGLTIEQRNVRDRLMEDNKPGSIKHLYIISAYSGQPLIYSTVRGKVTSSGKRLTPSSIVTSFGGSNYAFPVQFGKEGMYTSEVLQDDGTYGSSVEYLFWFDTKGVYHQQYVTGGMIVHVSNEPVAVKGVVINMETDIKSPGSK